MTLESLKFGLKSLVYASGLFSWWHRRRNADTLTVFMFHRVLPRDSEAYAHAEKEFTFSVEGFGRCLDFIAKHYRVVSADTVSRALEGKAALPKCAALITFDDGWRDTLVYAYPQLKQRNLPALVFLATEIMESTSSAWWQDMLVQIMAQPEKAEPLLQKLGLPKIYARQRSRDIDHEVAGKVASLPLPQRIALLAASAPPAMSEQQMLTSAELSSADRACFEFGAHGHSHAPLTTVPDASLELEKSRAYIETLRPAVPTMSFPHGAYTDAVLDQAKNSGFELIFTSDPTLLDLHRRASVRSIGRIHIPENEWTTHCGRISFAKLATYLFFRPKASC